MALTNLTVSKLFTYVDQKRVYTPQDGSSGQNNKNRALTLTLWDLQNEFQLPWSERTATLDYLDTVTEYSAPDGLEKLLALTPDDFTERIDHKEVEEFERMDNRGVTNISAMEIKNRTKVIRLKFNGRQSAASVDNASSYDGNGTWTADTSGSDASNVTTDEKVYRQFSGSVNFDVVVAQSANNYATIYNPSISAVDLSDEEDTAHFVLDFYLPSATNISSFDLFWTDQSGATPSTRTKYWTKNVTTQINSGAFATGWNVLDFDWATAIKTGAPNSAAIRYLEVRVNYSASQANDTDFRINYIRAVVPETVTYRFSTAYIAVNSSGTLIDEITAASDVLMFSGMDTKFMKAVISGCLYQLFGDDYEHDGEDENKWEKRWEADKMKLALDYPPRVLVPERRVKIYNTSRSSV